MATKKTNKNQMQDQMEKMGQAAANQAEEFSNYSKDTFQAWMQSTHIMMETANDMIKNWSSYSEKTQSKNAAALKEMMSCKSVEEMTQTSAKLAQETMEETMSTATEMSEQTVKMMMDAMEPLNSQISNNFMQNFSNMKKSA